MRIGVISDTHDHLENIDRAIALLGEQRIDLLCHLGDWVAPYAVDEVVREARKLPVPVKGVFGNNDGEIFLIVSKNPHEWGVDFGHHTLAFEAGGKRIVLYHGTDPRITEALARSGEYDAVFVGHTHLPRNEVVGRTLVLNPGTLSGFSIQRGGRLSQGECALYDTTKGTAELFSFPL